MTVSVVVTAREPPVGARPTLSLQALAAEAEAEAEGETAAASMKIKRYLH